MNNIQVLNQLQSRLGSANWNDWQIHRWSFYDYVRYPSAGTASPLSFFTVPVGGTDPNSALAKTYEQTNVPKGGSLGQVYFFIQQIRTHLHILPKQRQPTGIPADADYLVGPVHNGFIDAVHNLSGMGVLLITLGQKEYFDIEKPFKNAPSGLAVDIDQVTSVGATASYWYQQSGNQRDIWNASPPQMIEPEQNIQINLTFPNGASPALTDIVGGSITPYLNIGVILDGYIARPAQ